MDEVSKLTETLEAIEAYVNEQQEAIEKGKALERLKKNQDFNDVIVDGYFEAEAQKLFKILTDPTGASEYTNEEIHLKLGSISDFRGYVGTDEVIGTVEMAALRAPSNIAMNEDERVKITAEYAEAESN